VLFTGDAATLELRPLHAAMSSVWNPTVPMLPLTLLAGSQSWIVARRVAILGRREEWR
jgi:hypothetical protein